MNKLGSYPAYKPTAIPWLPQVPEHWSEMKVKYIFRERVQKGYPNEPLLAATQSMGVVTKETYGERTVTAQKDLHLLKLVEKNDFVISLRSFQGGIEVSHARGIISPAYTILRISHDCAPGYLAFLLKSAPFIDGLKLFITGIREGQNIDYARLARTYLPWPPLEEQHLIVRYLRALDAKVKRYIRTKRTLIARLQEQKQAIIQRAVTRGLDPNVKLKPSGVEWLGEVPEHWEVSMVKRQYRIDLGKMLNASKGLEHSTYPYLNAANIHWDRIKLEKVNEMTFNAQQRTHYRLVKGDVLVTEGGATVGRTAIWNEELTECYYQNSINRARPTGHMPGRYLLHWMFYVTRSGLIEAASNAATFGHLTKEKLSRLPLLVPPRDEAIAIVEHIDRECSALVEPERRLHAQIAMMQEYRTRLIADVVTGAVDVREAAGKLLEEDQMIGRSDYQMMEEEPLSMAAEGEAEYGEE